MVTMIKCEDCGKEIELKNWRTRCVRCTNIRSHKLAAERRATKESKEYFKKYNKKRRAS